MKHLYKHECDNRHDTKSYTEVDYFLPCNAIGFEGSFYTLWYVRIETFHFVENSISERNRYESTYVCASNVMEVYCFRSGTYVTLGWITRWNKLVR